MKPWTGWAIVDSDSKMYEGTVRRTRHRAWLAMLGGLLGTSVADARRQGFRAVKVTLVEVKP